VSAELPIIYLARHGETAWSLSGQHTGLTDLPLTERGERNARRLGERLRGFSAAKVFTSPLQRAARTCELAGFGAVAEIDRDLAEWDYGEYEGRRTTDKRLCERQMKRYAAISRPQPKQQTKSQEHYEYEIKSSRQHTAPGSPRGNSSSGRR